MLCPRTQWVPSAESRPENARMAQGDSKPVAYAELMMALTSDQLELSLRAHDGLQLWRGSTVTDRLRRDVELLLTLRLIEPLVISPIG